MQCLETKIDIAEVIDKKRVVTYFQPVISIGKRRIIGVEALCRGVNKEGKVVYSPDILFSAAEKKNLLVELDRLCRCRALEAFANLCSSEPGLLLFLNIDAAVIDQAFGTSFLANTVKNMGIPTSNIVVEINEMRACSSGSLQGFAMQYRKLGFAIALDDVGAGFSNVERIVLAKPDIIKIDRSITTGIDKQYRAQTIVRRMVRLSRNTNTQVVAEGVEAAEEVSCLIKLGIDLLQGFYYLRPQPSSEFDYKSCSCKILQQIK